MGDFAWCAGVGNRAIGRNPDSNMETMSELILQLGRENSGGASFPKVPATVQADLLRIGGTNDYGEPKLKLVWGESEQWFRAGKWRLKYPKAQKFRRLAAWNEINAITGETKNYPPDKQPPVVEGFIIAPVYEDIAIGYKGWILEEWWPPEVVMIGRAKVMELDYLRWQPMEDGSMLDLLGEPPIRGEFRFVMYMEDLNFDPPKPMMLDDRRVIEIVERAMQLRQDQGAADGWRTVQSPEKAKEMYRKIAEDREADEKAESDELEEFITDAVKGYARKMRGAYLS
jgi:hypothetical protein